MVKMLYDKLQGNSFFRNFANQKKIRMITASAKKRENIAEYLLYMWQIEDLIRAFSLDIDKIKSEIVDKYVGIDDGKRREMLEWYESLIDMMQREGKGRSGHLQLNINTLNDIERLHRQMLNDPKFAAYATQYYSTLPLIVELRSKAGDNKKDEIETCFDALYGILMLRLQKREVSEETLAAASQITRFLAVLSDYYRQDYNNELKFSEDD